jgi:intracellular septation protein A
VLGHVLPRLVEATVIPTVIFYAVWRTLGSWPAMMAAAAWTGGVIVRRILRTGRVPGLVLIASLGLGARTLVSILTGSTFVYFLQPAIVTAVIATTFLVSVATGRPIVRRLAAEFCPLSDADSARHGVQRLFRGLTLLWGFVLLANAVVTLVVLLTVSVNTFVIVKSIVTPGLTCAAALCTIFWAVRVARREGLDRSRGATAMLPA